MKIIPPGVKPKWDDNDVETQAKLLAYSWGRDKEDAQLRGLV